MARKYSTYSNTSSATTTLSAPSNLVLTVISDTQINLAWTDNSTGEDGFKIERGTDGVNYSQIDTSVSNSYNNTTGIVQGTLYYYRVRAYKGAVNSSYCSAQSATTYNYFTTTWNTENAGSATKTIVIPFGAAYDVYITWGDGSAEEHATGAGSGSVTHIYPTTGIKTIKIRSTSLYIYFNNTGDKSKLLTIANWGGAAWSSMNGAFYGCINLTGTYSDIPNFSAVTDFTQAFRSCSVFNSSVANWNTAEVTTFSNMFTNCAAFNQSPNTWDVRKASFGTMFYGCTIFNQSLSSWNTALIDGNKTFINFLGNANAFKQSLANFNIVLTSSFAGMISGDINATGTSTNYDNTLISWAAQAAPNTKTFNAGTSKYSDAAQAARDHLVLAVGSGGHSWTIVDGGHI